METPVIDRVQISLIEEHEKDWVDEIKDFIEMQILPTDREKARFIQKVAAKYTVIKEVLFKRSYSQAYLRCVKAHLITRTLYEVHEGVCGGHPAARTLSDKIKGAGLYWPTMRKDAEDYVRKCDKCQRFADVPRLPSTEQTMVVPAWPFDMWGIDLIGPFPKAKGKMTHVVVAVDYFTKWVEAKALATISEENIINFVHDQIWCRFGLPRVIVSDNGTQFATKFTAECNRLRIEHRQSAVAYPEGNGQAEAANKLVLTALKKILENKKSKWVDELNTALWVVRTTVRNSTGETPFSLTYGSEAMAPVEVALPTYRVIHFDETKNEAARRQDLDDLEEKRMMARMKMVNYKQKAKAHHDKRVKKRSFSVGDWVLRNVAVQGTKPGYRKLSEKWEGPYLVRQVIKEGTYMLRGEDGENIKNAWNSNHLRRYYF